MQRAENSVFNRKLSAENSSGQIAALEERIKHLEDELSYANLKVGQTADRMNTLMTLIRKAWSGDTLAAVSVANIVGIAVPSISTTTSEPEAQTSIVHMTNKNKALNNWATLSVQLLNRSYKEAEDKLARRQHEYLQERQSFLNHQLTETPKGIGRLNMLKPNSMTEHLDRPRSASAARPLGITRNCRHMIDTEVASKLCVGHLYQQPPKASTSYNGKTTVADLVVDGRGRKTSDTWAPMDSLTQKDHTFMVDDVPTKNHSSLNGGYRLQSVQQDNQPTTKIVPNLESLFDPSTVLPPNNTEFGNRPPSGKQQKQADILRARPKSAKAPTRPQSSTKPVHPSGMRRERVQSAPARRLKVYSEKSEGRKFFITNNSSSSNKAPPTSPDVSDDENNLALDLGKLQIENTVHKSNQSIYCPVHPKLAEGCEEDLNHMRDMENNFKIATILLQRKLGIPDSGIVF